MRDWQQRSPLMSRWNSDYKSIELMNLFYCRGQFFLFSKCVSEKRTKGKPEEVDDK